jgi:chromosome segregation ATPase
MEKAISFVPRLAIFLAGVAAGALTLSRREGSAVPNPAAAKEWKEAIADLERRLEARETSATNRFAQIETRLDEHAAKLAEVPSTSQIVSAMEQLLTKTMASLDERLSTQANSIEVLKTTVSQTDSLLERVLESLDSLQSYTDSTELGDDVLLHRPAV